MGGFYMRRDRSLIYGQPLTLNSPVGFRTLEYIKLMPSFKQGPSKYHLKPYRGFLFYEQCPSLSLFSALMNHLVLSRSASVGIRASSCCCLDVRFDFVCLGKSETYLLNASQNIKRKGR